MSFSDAVRSGFQQYATFSGRAGRSEYWFWTLFVTAVSFGTIIVDGIVGTVVLNLLCSFAIVVPSLSLAVRRLHDSGRSAWWLLVLYLPTIFGGALVVFASIVAAVVLLGGFILLVYVFVQPSQPGTNQYGSQPGTGAAEA